MRINQQISSGMYEPMRDDFLNMVGKSIRVFTKRGFRREMPLDFLKFVTDRRSLGIVTLGGFRKAGISEGEAIIFFGVCNRQGDSGLRDIK